MTVAKQLATVGVVGAVLVGVASASGIARPTAQPASLAIAQVGSTPKGKGPLSSRHVNVVIANSNLSFIVKIRNGAVRRPVRITLIVPRPDSSLGPIVKAKTVVLRASRIGTVKLGPFAPIQFAQRETLRLLVTDTQRLRGWTTSYPVIFSLG